MTFNKAIDEARSISGNPMLALETTEEGIAALKRQGFDIIITDYWLSGMGRIWRFANRIRNNSPELY